MKNISTIIFDLDGTIYQNTDFHRNYLRFLVDGTEKESWLPALIDFAEAVFCGKRLMMNAFYSSKIINADAPETYFNALDKALIPDIGYDEAFFRDDCINTGDAWAVVTLIGKTLGLLEGEQVDAVYRRTRDKMSADGMTGDAHLKKTILEVNKKYNTILLSNSYQSTALEFLKQLNFENVFENIVYSANKPFGMVDALYKQDPTLFENPESILSIGDHAFNDLIPLQRLGCRTLWVNPYPNINECKYDAKVKNPAELADYLEEMCR